MGSEDVKIDVFWICDVSIIDTKEMMNPDDKPVLKNIKLCCKTWQDGKK